MNTEYISQRLFTMLICVRKFKIFMVLLHGKLLLSCWVLIRYFGCFGGMGSVGWCLEWLGLLGIDYIWVVDLFQLRKNGSEKNVQFSLWLEWLLVVCLNYGDGATFGCIFWFFLICWKAEQNPSNFAIMGL